MIKQIYNILDSQLMQYTLYDESGVMCYEYGNMGEVTKETRIYALPFLSQPLALSTLFEYDSWGRILNITYPDNEIVSYDYDLGGQLERMYNNSSYTYLDNIIYDKFGAKTSQDYGNGIVTQYTYNDTTRRLTDILTSNNFSLHYTYDLVGNVTQVTSVCPWLQNQSFTENFSYDSTDQLTAAQESQNNGYQLVVNYDNWGKIMQYDIAQTDMLGNATETHSRSYAYPTANYIDAQTSFAPVTQTGDEHVFLSYGINGSLRQREVQTPNPHTEYYLFNSQGNLKAYSDDVMSFAYYGYNAANTRTYKLSLYNTNLWINGQQQPLNLQWQNAMFYPNTYLNFNQNGEYTKHYYNGMERIASRLGDNTTTIALNSNILEESKLQLEEQFREDIHKLIEETVPIDLPPFIDVNALQPTGTPNDIYYYHPNHLGSTSFVTDNNATITQGFLYAPFGEITTEYNINFGNNVIPKYSFNAKELDEETGMYYYEARYYAPPTFTSRDPHFEKYFWMSPYAYCANNPVKYVDPDGKKVVITGDDSEEATNQLNSSTSEHFIIIRNDDGSLSYQGKAITKRDRIIKKAIDDRTITVNIEASKNNMFIWQDGANLGTECGGGYGGNSVKDGLVNTYQKVVPSMLDKRDNDVEGRSSGLYMLHEVAESYFGGIIAQRTGKSSPREGLYGTTYSKAHRRANRIAGGKYNYRKEEETIRYPDGSPVINPLTGEPVRKVIFEGYSRY